MEEKISKILHLVHIGGIYVFGMFAMIKLDWPDFVYPLWTLVYAVGYLAYKIEYDE